MYAAQVNLSHLLEAGEELKLCDSGGSLRGGVPRGAASATGAAEEGEPPMPPVSSQSAHCQDSQHLVYLLTCHLLCLTEGLTGFLPACTQKKAAGKLEAALHDVLQHTVWRKDIFAASLSPARRRSRSRSRRSLPLELTLLMLQAGLRSLLQGAASGQSVTCSN